MAAAQLKADTALVNQLHNAVEAASDDDGWAPLASMGNITEQRPDFDSRNYGYAELSDLITATTLFELDRRSPGDGKPAVIYTRDKIASLVSKANRSHWLCPYVPLVAERLPGMRSGVVAVDELRDAFSPHREVCHLEQ